MISRKDVLNAAHLLRNLDVIDEQIRQANIELQNFHNDREQILTKLNQLNVDSSLTKDDIKPEFNPVFDKLPDIKCLSNVIKFPSGSDDTTQSPSLSTD